jgi:hypothetical protein
MAVSVVLIVLVLWWDGWIRVAHCFSFVKNNQQHESSNPITKLKQ